MSARLARAADLLREGKHAEAKRECDTLVQLYPDFYPAYVYRGIAQSNLGQFAEAEKSFSQALRLHPNSSGLHYNLALAYLRQNKIQEGIGELKRAIELDPNNAQALYNLGVALLDENRASEAVPYLERAERSGFKAPELSVQFVRANLLRGEANQVRDRSEQILAEYADQPALQITAGELFLSGGLPSLARKHLEKAQALLPGDDRVDRLLVEAYLQEGLAPKALEILDGISSEARDTYYYLLKAQAHGILSQLELASQAIEKALEKSPNDPTVLLTVARLHQKFGNQERAIEFLKTTDRLESDSPDVFYSLAVSHYILKAYEAALAELGRALQLRPAFHQAHFLKGLVELERGNLDAARPHLEKARQLQPHNIFYLTIYGMHLAFENRLEPAFQTFREALSISPGYATAHYQLGKTLIRLNRHEEAVNALERAIELKPDLWDAYYPLGQVYRKLGQMDKAQQALDTFLKYRERERTTQEEILSTAREALEK